MRAVVTPLLLATTVVGATSGPAVPINDRVAETERLRSLGLSVPDGGVVLEHPWDPPFTRRSYVVPQAWFVPPAPDAGVRADVLAADLPILQEVMRRAYGGWDTAEKRGWNWDRWFEQWRDQLLRAGRTELPLPEAFAPVRSLLEFQLDNHTNIPIGRSTYFGSGSQSAVLETAPRAPCTELRNGAGGLFPVASSDPAQQPRRVKRWNGQRKKLEAVTYLALPASRGAPAAIRCGGAWIPLRPGWPAPVSPFAEADSARERLAPVLKLSGAKEDGPALRIAEPSIAYLRLPTFSKKNSQRLEAELGSWPKPTGRERVLIVDLRDNGGGDVAVEALQNWVDPKRLERAFQIHRRQGSSCLYHALRWGYLVASSRGVSGPLPPEMRKDFQGALETLFQPSPAECPRSFEESHGGWDYRQHGMAKPGPVDGHRRILVLVNNGTGSDGEFMTALLASLPETVVAGINTFGVGQYIQPGYSVLPHTRLPIRIALGTNDIYGDNRSFDGYGLDVDVLLPTEAEQSPESILSLARYLGG